MDGLTREAEIFPACIIISSNCSSARNERGLPVLSEFGGYSYREPGHCAKEKLYGYGICKNKKDLEKRFLERWSGVRNLIPQGLSASIYTQWTDVEEEVNGVFTYDREVRKIEPF